MHCVIYQDNWVYAPNGGIRKGWNTATDITSKLDETFFCQDAMIKMCEDILKSKNREDWDSVRRQVEKNDKEALRSWIYDHKSVTDVLNKNMKFNYTDISSAIGTYNDISTTAQWVIEYLPEEGGTLLGTISKAGSVLGHIDRAVFIGEKLYNAKMNQLPNALAEGNFNICLYNTPMYGDAPEPGVDYYYWWVPMIMPYSCVAWQERDGVNGKYISRYVDAGNTKHMRCMVVPFD